MWLPVSQRDLEAIRRPQEMDGEGRRSARSTRQTFQLGTSDPKDAKALLDEL